MVDTAHHTQLYIGNEWLAHFKKSEMASKAIEAIEKME